MQDTRVWRPAFGLDRATVIEKVVFDGDESVVARVRARRGAPGRCGRCRRRAPWYDRGHGRRRWRALDIGTLPAFIEAEAPRVNCPEHGPTVAAVAWARHNARHSHEFDQTVTWLARFYARIIVAQFMRVAWQTVGAIIARVMSDVDALGPDRFDNVRRIGIDEVAYQKGHRYLLVVVNHANGQLLWVGKGRTKRTLGEFFAALGEERCQRIALVSADGADWIADMVGLNCPNAQLCLDPFHVVSWVTEAVDKVRRRVVGDARRAKDNTVLSVLRDARWAVLKNPDRLNKQQRLKLIEIEQINNPLYRSYLLKEHFRAIFAPGGEERILAFDDWMLWASRCRIPEIVDVARRIRPYRVDIVATLTHRLSNAVVEGLNGRVRLLINIARGFRSTEALMALMHLHLGRYKPTLPGRPTPTAALP